jgi:iron complex transport system ATP-binding protein
MITLHDLTLAARLADRVVVLCEGRIVGDGPAEVVLTTPLLASVYGVEAAVDRGPNGLRVELLGRRRD